MTSSSTLVAAHNPRACEKVCDCELEVALAHPPTRLRHFAACPAMVHAALQPAADRAHDGLHPPYYFDRFGGLH